MSHFFSIAVNFAIRVLDGLIPQGANALVVNNGDAYQSLKL